MTEAVQIALIATITPTIIAILGYLQSLKNSRQLTTSSDAHTAQNADIKRTVEDGTAKITNGVLEAATQAAIEAATAAVTAATLKKKKP
jgi:hypothetical protein